MNMLLLIQLDILDFIFKGILIGIIASAPMGPVGILCIQRTLNKGRWYGFITGVGAAISDIIYALTVGLGMSFIMEPLQDPTNQFVLQNLWKCYLDAFLVFIALCLIQQKKCARGVIQREHSFIMD